MGVEEHIAMKKEGLRSVPEVVFGETLWDTVEIPSPDPHAIQMC